MMYIISEENHSNLCVARDVVDAILWLMSNDWLTPDTEGVNENDETFCVADVVRGSKKDKTMIFHHLMDLTVDSGENAVFEWLEQFGLYISEIEVAP